MLLQIEFQIGQPCYDMVTGLPRFRPFFQHVRRFDFRASGPVGFWGFEGFQCAGCCWVLRLWVKGISGFWARALRGLVFRVERGIAD